MQYALVEKKNAHALHGIFSSKESAQKHLRDVIPDYVRRSFFTDKSLKANSFKIIAYDVRKPYKSHKRFLKNPGVKRTTAQYRTLAREAEKKLQWQRAARYWSLAVAAYPGTGALAEADKKNMREYAHSARIFRGNPSPRRALRRAHIGHRIFIIVRHEGLWTTPQQTPKKSYALATTFDEKKAVAFTDKDSAFDFMKLHFPGKAYRELHTIKDVRQHLKAGVR